MLFFYFTKKWCSLVGWWSDCHLQSVAAFAFKAHLPIQQQRAVWHQQPLLSTLSCLLHKVPLHVCFTTLCTMCLWHLLLKFSSSYWQTLYQDDEALSVGLCWISLCWLFFFILVFVDECHMYAAIAPKTLPLKTSKKEILVWKLTSTFQNIITISPSRKYTHTFVPQLQMVWSHQSINRSIRESVSQSTFI